MSSDVAERLLGHTLRGRGVEATYDRHDYLEEKADALRALAGLVREIVTPPPNNVVPLPTRPQISSAEAQGASAALSAPI